MSSIDVATVKALLPLLEELRRGNGVVIEDAGRPVAKLIRIDPERQPRRPGALEGQIRIAEDFDELPEDLARAFGGSEPDQATGR